MKAVILAGGLGTRIAEETITRPKPMVEIGGKPILWHIMKTYSASNINDFIICCGYKGYVIKEYFQNYFLHESDVTFDLKEGSLHIHQKNVEPWKVTLVDTGEHTQTGGRLGRVADHLKDEEAFCFTYGDGLSNINFSEQISFHKNHGRLATITAVKPPGRYGALSLSGMLVHDFSEKPKGDGGKINGGFFVLSRDCLELIDGDECIWEIGPLKRLAEMKQLVAFEHDGFWQPMDTLREKQILSSLWERGDAPWRTW